MKYVLVVDDDKVVNLLITRELQKKGYGVFMSYDAVQAGTFQVVSHWLMSASSESLPSCTR